MLKIYFLFVKNRVFILIAFYFIFYIFSRLVFARKALKEAF